MLFTLENIQQFNNKAVINEMLKIMSLPYLSASIDIKMVNWPIRLPYYIENVKPDRISFELRLRFKRQISLKIQHTLGRYYTKVVILKFANPHYSDTCLLESNLYDTCKEFIHYELNIREL